MDVNGAVLPIAFVNSGYPSGAATRALRLWSSHATIQDDDPVINYAVGDVVMHQGVMYRCLTTHSDVEPTASAPVWEALPIPADDLRVMADSPYAGLGVR